MQTINIKGVGLRNFPDTMSQEEIKAVLREKFGKPEMSSEMSEEMPEPMAQPMPEIDMSETNDLLRQLIEKPIPEPIDISPELSQMTSLLQETLNKMNEKPEEPEEIEEEEIEEAEPEEPPMAGVETLLKELIALEGERKVAYQQMKEDMQNTVYDIKRDRNGRLKTVVPVIKDKSGVEFTETDVDYKDRVH